MDNGNYKCRICDKRYVSLLNKPYRKHLEMYHKDLMVEDVAFDFNLKINDLAGDKNNRFKCIHCDKTYINSSSKAFKTHLNVFYPDKEIKINLLDSLDNEDYVNKIYIQKLFKMVK